MIVTIYSYYIKHSDKYSRLIYFNYCWYLYSIIYYLMSITINTRKNIISKLGFFKSLQKL